MKSCAARVAKAIEQLEKRRDLALTGSPTVPLPAVNPHQRGFIHIKLAGAPKMGAYPPQKNPRDDGGEPMLKVYQWVRNAKKSASS